MQRVKEDEERRKKERIDKARMTDERKRQEEQEARKVWEGDETSRLYQTFIDKLENVGSLVEAKEKLVEV